jgi:galactoside O-acetyltransferase
LVNDALSGGYYSREELLELGFKSVGTNTRVSKIIAIQDTAAVELGANVRIDAYTTITTGDTGFLKVGDNTHIADGVRILAGAGVEIGRYVGLAPRVTILSSSDDYSGEFMVGPMVPQELTGVHRKRVNLGSFSVVGTNSVVMPGCSLAEGVAVGALSLVNRPLAPWGVYFGSPVKYFKPRSKNILTLVESLDRGEL